MAFSKEVVNGIVRICIEQSFFNNSRVINVQTDLNGNVDKYQLELSEWFKREQDYSFCYDNEIQGYKDEREKAMIYINKQYILESLYMTPEKFIRDGQGEIKIFDFVKAMHTRILYRTEILKDFYYIQVKAPACIKMTFNKENELIRYEDMNSKVFYIET